jgi:N-acetyl-anhydromuramyl-L-alanine amidase AmpD
MATKLTATSDWMPDADIRGVVLHWTGGNHKPSAGDLKHYHLLVDGDANLVRGVPSIAANGVGSRMKPRASHTRNNNTGWAAVSLCGMAEAVEFPFSAGHQPITQAQWLAAAEAVAALCERYSIPVARETVLTHAEVQGTLGVAQSGKWDVTRLPWDLQTVGAATCGDEFRRLVLRAMSANHQMPPVQDSLRPTLREGAAGENVRALQTALTGHGLAIAADGRWGPITTRAVRAFQRARGLKPDGVAGPATWRELAVRR